MTGKGEISRISDFHKSRSKATWFYVFDYQACFMFLLYFCILIRHNSGYYAITKSELTTSAGSTKQVTLSESVEGTEIFKHFETKYGSLNLMDNTSTAKVRGCPCTIMYNAQAKLWFALTTTDIIISSFLKDDLKMQF